MSDSSSGKDNSFKEYEDLKNSFLELEREERKLRDYLTINIFDYAQNRDNMEDVFAIKNSSLFFNNKTRDCPEINPNFPILEINNLVKFYASRKVPSLLNVSLRVYLGDLHVVIGANGSGKTTLFNCLKGVEEYKGEVLVDRKDLQSESFVNRNRIISFMDADISWDLYATVEDVIRSRFLELNMTEIEAMNYIRSALHQFNLSQLRNVYVIDLSLLEKRKIQFIVALCSDPHLIVMDEVFLGLQQHEILDLLVILSKLKQEDRAVLAFSHSFNDFSKFANTVSIISEGKIYYTGLVENLFLTQQNKYSIVTLDNSAALEILPKIKCNFSYNQLIDTIYVKFDGKLNLLLFQKECMARNIIIHEIRPIETNLNDLYPLLTKVGNKNAIRDINAKAYFSPPEN